MLRFKCYGLRFEWLKLKFNSGFYPREGRYAIILVPVVVVPGILVLVALVLTGLVLVVLGLVVLILVRLLWASLFRDLCGIPRGRQQASPFGVYALGLLT